MERSHFDNMFSRFERNEGNPSATENQVTLNSTWLQYLVWLLCHHFTGPLFLLAKHKDPKAVWDERPWGVILPSIDHQAASHFGQLTPKRRFMAALPMKEPVILNG